MAKIFYIFLVGLVHLAGAANEHPLINYYVRISSDNSVLELGRYEGNSYRMKQLLVLPADSLRKEDLRRFFNLTGDTGEVFVYLHCWLGNQTTFHKITLKGLNSSVTSDSNHRMGTTISIIWNSGLRGYQKSWELAPRSGKCVYKLLEWVTELKNGRASLFCHSMGNRVFEGVAAEASKNSAPTIRFREIVLAAADLESDVLEHSFRGVPQITGRLHILTNDRDRLLLLSKMIHGRGRLGLGGPANKEAILEACPNLYVVDVTKTVPLITPEPGNHLYFHWNPKVKNHLSIIFSHRQLPSDKTGRWISLD
jgi:hypothetical protein